MDEDWDEFDDFPPPTPVADQANDWDDFDEWEMPKERNVKDVHPGGECVSLLSLLIVQRHDCRTAKH